MVRCAVWTRHAGPVDDEDHRQLVERDVHDRLVEGAREKRRVDADHRMHARHREACRERDRVLLADADIEEAIRKLFRKVQQAG